LKIVISYNNCPEEQNALRIIDISAEEVAEDQKTKKSTAQCLSSLRNVSR
jgi:hypothetical protein